VTLLWTQSDEASSDEQTARSEGGDGASVPSRGTLDDCGRYRPAAIDGPAHAAHVGRNRRSAVAIEADGHTVRFEDGSELEVSAVIWATGYRPDYSWIKLPIFDDDGRLRHRRGVADVPGLYFLGLTWQQTRGSALIGWVRDDAEFIAERIAAYQESKARPSVRTPVGAGASARARSDERS
jgi:hypothetical protein